jgi:ribosomal protein L35
MSQKQKPPKPSFEQKRKWATFTYFGPETRMINKLFKNTDVGISFRTKNNIKNHLRIKRRTTNKYNLSGVYQVHCAECPCKYIGQTG